MKVKKRCNEMDEETTVCVNDSGKVTKSLFMETCPTCDGTGEVHSHNPKCWECRGKGKVMTKNESVDTASTSPTVHTPEPWKYHEAGAIVTTADGQMCVAEIRGLGSLEKEFGTSQAIKIMDANGRLIADAPKMLALIRDLHDFAEPMRHYEYIERGRKAFRDAAVLLEEHGG